MKTKILTLLFLLISAAVLQVNSQTISMGAVDSDSQTITSVKAFESRYLNDKVYLHITVKGNTETKMVAVERSLDAINFEVIGYIKLYGTPVQCDLAYYFTDESPVSANLYYRLSDYAIFNGPAYSETISIIPIDEYKAPVELIAITPVSIEQEQTNNSPRATK